MEPLRNQYGGEMNDTLKYYNKNWKEFKSRVHDRDLDQYYKMFLSHVSGKRILDLGCGTGRDASFFDSNGYEVVAVDGSTKMVELTLEVCPKIECYQLDFTQPFVFDQKFSGVWAMASLLHVDKRQIDQVLGSITKSLDKEAALFVSLKRSDKKPSDGMRMFEFWEFDEFVSKLESHGYDVVDSSENSQNEVEWITIVATRV